jgi:hypothetical protein
MLKEEAHTQKAAEAAVGLGQDKRRARQDVAENEIMKDVDD